MFGYFIAKKATYIVSCFLANSGKVNNSKSSVLYLGTIPWPHITQ